MRGMGVEGMDQRRSLQDQSDSRVAVTVNPPLVALGQAKPALQIKIIPNRFILTLPNEEPGKEAEHHRGHAVADRVVRRLKLIDQRLEFLLPFGDILRPGLKGRGYLRDDRDIFSNHFLLLFNFV
jgi:hypothetical protein